MTTPELIKWLRDNSSGVYRPASEAADLIDRLANVLRETVGMMDAFQIMESLPGLSNAEKMMIRVNHRTIKEMLETVMPAYDTVCREIHEANAEPIRAGVDSELP